MDRALNAYDYDRFFARIISVGHDADTDDLRRVLSERLPVVIRNVALFGDPAAGTGVAALYDYHHGF